MRAVGEDRQAHKVWKHVCTLVWSVYLHDQLRGELGLRFIADVHDARHRERRKTGRARALPSSVGNPPATSLINMDDVRFAPNADGDGVLRNRPILEQKLTDDLDLWIGKPRLHLTRIENHEPIVWGYVRIGQIRCRRWNAGSYGIEPIPIVTDGKAVCR